MRAEQTCEIVRDLMPSLAEGLVAPKTEAWIKEHLEECPECKEIWDTLMIPEPITPNTLSEKQLNKKVNFMKKIRRTTAIKIIVIAAVICALCFGGFYMLRVKKFYIPTKDISLKLGSTYFSTSSQIYEIKIDDKYSFATQEKGPGKLLTDEIWGSKVEYPIRYYYTLWDALFAPRVQIAHRLLINSDFVQNEFPELELEKTPVTVYLLGDSDQDRLVLQDTTDIFSAMNKILVRSADTQNKTGTEELIDGFIVYENERVIMRTDITEADGLLPESLKEDDFPLSGNDISLSLHNILMRGVFTNEELAVLSESGIIDFKLVEMTGKEYKEANIYAEEAFADVPDDCIVQIANVTLSVSPTTPIVPLMGYRSFFSFGDGFLVSAGWEELYDPDIADVFVYTNRENRVFSFEKGYREVYWALSLEEANEEAAYYYSFTDGSDYYSQMRDQYDEKDGSGPLFK